MWLVCNSMIQLHLSIPTMPLICSSTQSWEQEGWVFQHVEYTTDLLFSCKSHYHNEWAQKTLARRLNHRQESPNILHLAKQSWEQHRPQGHYRGPQIIILFPLLGLWTFSCSSTCANLSQFPRVLLLNYSLWHSVSSIQKCLTNWSFRQKLENTKFRGNWKQKNNSSFTGKLFDFL